ncbi:hypothetical protein GCM10010909_19680 [Acidocella aquatica]|uniref:Clostridial hydrophobic W n=1 Tax=Acidocella aquatica TaxID=1922313 RepID=A0ABQ6A7N0_9PROT|nr:hypothetical protein [Acidocella aquatica]GLR67287.1 hypothetical protein GCM10010909_19680 [Acidocella aquatica]
MAQVKQAQKPAESSPQPNAGASAGDNHTSVQELKVSGHLMTLPAGLFCFVNEANPAASQNNGMPGVRISPPPAGGQNIEISSFRADGWMNADGDAALVRIRKGPAQVLVTIYQLPNMPDAAPKLQVRQLLTAGDMPAVAANAPAPAPAPAPVAPEVMDMMAHIQTRGDVGAKFGVWLGERGSQNWIEGFALNAPEGINPADLSYQAVLGRGWLSPWVEAGQYCGSRGMALPLLGLRIRLTGEAAENYELSCSASFVGGASAGPAGNDETCEADTLAPLEAFQITLTPRTRRGGKAKR